MSNKKPVGRPTKYSEDIQKKADEYVDSYQLYKEYVDSSGKVHMMVNSIPSIAGLAKHLGLHRETLYNWAKDHRQFFDTLEAMKQTQETFLIHHGLTKGYDSGFAKFLAINMTEFKDKVEQTIDHKNISINIDKEDSEL